jgi:hypothetical protein
MGPEGVSIFMGIQSNADTLKVSFDVCAKPRIPKWLYSRGSI